MFFRGGVVAQVEHRLRPAEVVAGKVALQLDQGLELIGGALPVLGCHVQARELLPHGRVGWVVLKLSLVVIDGCGLVATQQGDAAQVAAHVLAGHRIFQARLEHLVRLFGTLLAQEQDASMGLVAPVIG